MSRAYLRFKADVLGADAAYARDGDPAHLRRIADLFRTLPSVEARPVLLERWTVGGWLTQRRLVSRTALRRANPDWRIRVARIRRPDVDSRRWRRRGFLVTAIGRAEAVPFEFVLASRDAATPSSAEVRAQAHRLGWPIRRQGTPTAYLEDIRRAPAADARPDRWIDAVVCESPTRLWAFANSDEGEPWRQRFVAALDATPSERWADRYRLLLGGESLRARSELLALSVRRPIPDEAAPVDGIAIPQLRREGDVVRPAGQGPVAPAPGTGWLAVDDARIQGGGTLWSGGELVCYELAADPSNNMVAGQWNHLFGSKANPTLALLDAAPEASQVIQEGILIGGRADENWYHWMVDYLPRVLEIPERIEADVPILVSDRVPHAGLQALHELTDRRVVRLDPTRATRVGRIHVAAPVVQLIDDPGVGWAGGFALRASSLRRLRKHWGVSDTGSPGGRRIFLSRRSGIRRGIENEAVLVEVASRAGLEIVDPATLTFAEQLELFKDSTLVVGGSGAVMANYLFLRPGAEVIALTSRQLWDFVMPAALAQVAGASFRYLTGPSTISLSEVHNLTEWIHAPFAIDPELLGQELATSTALRK